MIHLLQVFFLIDKETIFEIEYVQLFAKISQFLRLCLFKPYVRYVKI